MVELQPVILAGGRGSHMLDMTSNMPKPLIPIGNKPLIWYTLNMLQNAGFPEVIIVTLNCVKNAVEIQTKEFKLTSTVIGISEDSEFDTVDSLLLIKDHIKTDVLIISCDLITDLAIHRLVDVHRLHDSSITMLLCPARAENENVPGVKPKKKNQQKQREFIGLCPTERNDQRVLFLLNEADLEDDTLPVRENLMYEFPQIQVRTDLHDAHLYIVKKWFMSYLVQNRKRSSLRSEVLPYVVRKQFSRNISKTSCLPTESDHQETFGKDIFSYFEMSDDKRFVSELTLAPDQQDRKDLRGLSCFAYVYDEGTCINVNTISAFVDANRYVSKTDSPLVEAPARVHSSSKVDEKSQVGADCLIGERTVVAERTSVKRSVIGKGCTIGSNVKIANCVIMDRVKIESGCNITGCVLCEEVIIGEKCELKDCFVGHQKNIGAASKLSRETLVENQAMMEIE